MHLYRSVAALILIASAASAGAPVQPEAIVSLFPPRVRAAPNHSRRPPWTLRVEVLLSTGCFWCSRFAATLPWPMTPLSRLSAGAIAMPKEA
jgi:hypothetical protein